MNKYLIYLALIGVFAYSIYTMRGQLGLSAAPIGYQAVARDAFPVFDNPEMLSAQEAEAKRAIFPRDAVIGVVHNGEAKAYPITVMGVHELGNDMIGGLPIAISW